MSFKHDYSGVQESGGFTPVPEGEYWLKITDTEEGKTRNGDPMVKVTLEIADESYKGKKVWHNVSFLPAIDRAGVTTPGAGFSKRWLHAIGEPYEGKVMVNHLAWRGKRVRAKLIVESYSDKSGIEKMKNRIDEVLLPDSDAPIDSVEAPAEEAEVSF